MAEGCRLTKYWIAALIFDAVFARKSFKEHPNKVSSVLFYWASLIIHDLFQTNHRDFSISMTSSYLDLAPLYGDNQADQDQIRTFKDGKLKPDCFSEQRMLGFPPGKLQSYWQSSAFSLPRY
jgi:linoleate 10R-lipoxygenase